MARRMERQQPEFPPFIFETLEPFKLLNSRTLQPWALFTGSPSMSVASAARRTTRRKFIGPHVHACPDLADA